MHANVSVFVPHLGCPCRCIFCNQNSISGNQKSPTPEEISELCLSSLSHVKNRQKECQFAFFGGSFTAIDPGAMINMLDAVQPYLGEDGFESIRISTRPDAIDKDILELLWNRGVRSIELGCQSMDDSVLTMNKRGHTAKHTMEAAKLIHSYGFELGVQLMVGLYGDTDESLMDSVRQMIRLNPATVRIYPVVVLRGTELEHLYTSGRYTPMSLEHCVSLCGEIIREFEESEIRVIRVGLHSQKEMMEQKIAGPYHPAFGQLCRSEQIFQSVLEKAKETGAVCITYPTKMQSEIIGQKRSNILRWKELGIQVELEKTDHLCKPKIQSIFPK